MATNSTSTDTVVVRESFYGQIDGEERLFRAGDLIHANDRAVKKWPAAFGPVAYNAEPKIERATAAPGEKR